MSRRWSAALAAAAALVAPAAAGADALISPPVVEAARSQVFTLVVEPEQDEAVTTVVELYPPPDFEVESFAPSPGWKRDWTIHSGQGIVQRAVWTREHVPGESGEDERKQGEEDEAAEELEHAAEEDAVFTFVAQPKTVGTHAFEVRQTYSDGKVVHWRGATSVAFSPTPAGSSVRTPPTIEAVSSLASAGDDDSSTLALVALVVGAVALAAAAAAVFLALAARRARPEG
jgi:uncharacterized protein YcnI